MDCVFCKIVSRELPANILLENNQLIAFPDIKPSAPVHILIVPKEHIESIAHLTQDHREIVADMIFAAKELAKNKGLKGYKLTFNVGREGGQVIDHLHLHLLA